MSNVRNAFAWVIVLAAAMPLPAADESSNDMSSRIDAIVDAACQTAGIVPARTCDDATFLRRVWLDLLGRVPPVLAARDFLDDSAPDKRGKLVDQLLASEEFADQWGRVLTEFLTDKRAILHPTYNGRVLRDYLRDALAADRSYQRIAQELIAGEGASDASGPVNFLLRYQVDPTQLAGAVANKFLGVSLQCAQCHHHPFDHWTQDDFWGLAACFARTRQLTANDGQLFGVVEARRGELEIDVPTPVAAESSAEGEPSETQAQPRAETLPEKKLVTPRLLDGTPLPPNSSRRAELAAWVTSDANPDFARGAVDAVWKRLFSQELVSGGMGVSEGLGAERLGTDKKGALASQLLEELASGFVAEGFSVKRVLRAILLSRTYARDAVAALAAVGEDGSPVVGGRELRCFARYTIRPLSVDELYQSVVQATGYVGYYEEMEGQPGDPETDLQSNADPAVEFLGDRAFTVQRSLALLNSDYLHQSSRLGARLCRAAIGRRITPAHVEYVFLAALSRRPSAEESKAMFEFVKAAPSGAKGLEDLFWLVLNSAEFNVNH